MIGVLTLMIPRSLCVYYRVMDATKYVRFNFEVGKLLKAGIFEGIQLQHVFNQSPDKMTEHTYMPLDNEEACNNFIAERIREKLYGTGDIREICNVGDHLDVPGVVIYGDNRVVTTSIYKYICDHQLWAASIQIERMDAATALAYGDVCVMSHLSRRDYTFDKTVVMNGGRSFLSTNVEHNELEPNRLKGAEHHRAAAISIYGLPYPSMSEASVAFDIPRSAVLNYVNAASDKWKDWIYTDRENKQATTYILTFTGSNIYYYGSTVDKLAKRLGNHTYRLTTRVHHSPKLQEAFDKYGQDNMVIEPLLSGTEQECRDLEYKLINDHKDDPNMANTIKDTGNTIREVLKDPEMEAKRIAKMKEALARPEVIEKRNKGTKDAWAVPGRKEARTGAGNPFAKKLMVDGVEYGSMMDAIRAKAGGMTDWQLRTRVKDPKYPNVYYI